MNCRRCGQPVERCPQPCGMTIIPGPCQGWRHADGWHYCADGPGQAIAEPEPGSLPVVESPAGPPEGEVA